MRNPPSPLGSKGTSFAAVFGISSCRRSIHTSVSTFINSSHRARENESRKALTNLVDVLDKVDRLLAATEPPSKS